MFKRSANVNRPSKFVPLGVLIKKTNTEGTFKNILTGLLLCCLLVDPLVAAFTWLYYQKSIVKREVGRQIISGMDKDELILLRFTKEEAKAKLHWENSKEFEYKRQMYDVVETMTSDDAVYYWCWLDHEETKLNRQLEDLTSLALGKDQKIKEQNERLTSFVKSLYFAISFNWHGSASGSFYKHYGLLLNLYSSVTIQPPTPPPQLG
jgi:hypothetical protein